MDHDGILILSFGGTQSRSLARRVRADQVYCEILKADISLEAIQALTPRGIILCGKPDDDETDIACESGVYALNIPVLAIGHAARRMVCDLGGRDCHTALENQTLQVHFSAVSPLFAGLSYGDRYVSRLDHVELPKGFSVIAHGHGLEVAFSYEEKRLYGMQFGVESNDPDGLSILSNFISLCGCARDWSTDHFIESQLAHIRQCVGKGHALMAISGGVDSSVCAALMHRAIGHQMHCIYIDTGLMRKGDTFAVRKLIGEHMGIDVRCVDACDRFLCRLQGLTDPEEKWAAISDEFSIIYREEAARFEGIDFLVKGTIYPDILDFSPEEQNLNEPNGYRLIEPLRYLFKNEVREVGERLSLPPEIISRQPLPGSGLAIRMTGEVTPRKLSLLREADALWRDAVEESGFGRRVKRCCAELVETTSTGGKKCRYIIALRALMASGSSETAYRMPYDLLEHVTERILSELPEIDRVVYDITPHPPRSAEWEG